MDDATPIPDDEPTDDEIAAEVADMEAAIDEPDDDDDDEPDPIPEPDWSERTSWLDSLTKFVKEASDLDHPGAKLTVGEALAEIRRILGRLR